MVTGDVLALIFGIFGAVSGIGGLVFGFLGRRDAKAAGGEARVAGVRAEAANKIAEEANELSKVANKTAHDANRTARRSLAFQRELAEETWSIEERKDGAGKLYLCNESVEKATQVKVEVLEGDRFGDPFDCCEISEVHALSASPVHLPKLGALQKLAGREGKAPDRVSLLVRWVTADDVELATVQDFHPSPWWEAPSEDD